MEIYWEETDTTLLVKVPLYTKIKYSFLALFGVQQRVCTGLLTPKNRLVKSVKSNQTYD